MYFNNHTLVIIIYNQDLHRTFSFSERLFETSALYLKDEGLYFFSMTEDNYLLKRSGPMYAMSLFVKAKAQKKCREEDVKVATKLLTNKKCRVE